MNYAIYNSLGYIRQISTTTNSTELDSILLPGESYIEVPPEVNNYAYYIRSDKHYALRPTQECFMEGLFIKNIEVPSLIYINGDRYIVDEPVVELEFDQPGTYKIRIESWPYLDKEFTYENTSQ
jgi:hypothetical protein